MEFKDISHEIYRSYEFPDKSTVIINEPLELNVSASGGHRILDEKGVSHYVPPKWIHLSWKSKPGSPTFAF